MYLSNKGLIMHLFIVIRKNKYRLHEALYFGQPDFPGLLASTAVSESG